MARLPREVVALGWVSFFNDVSSEMVYPLLPLFTVTVLGASATSLGWIEGLAQAVVAGLTAWAGIHSDRIRRRVPYVTWGYGLPLVGKAVLALAVAWPMVLVGRVVDRVGKGLRSAPRDALIADVTDPADRGRAFGLHRAMDSAGAVVGVLVAAGLLWWFTGRPTEGAATDREASAFRTVFAVAAVMGILALAFTFRLREPVHEDAGPATPSREPLPRAYWTVLILLLVFAVANSSDAFLLLRAANLGLSPWEIVLLYALMSGVYMLGAYPAGVLSDRIGRWRMIAFGWMLYAVVYTALAHTGPVAIWPLLALYGVQLAVTDGVGKALLVDHVPRSRRGYALGIFYMAQGVVTLTSSVVAGLLWDHVDPAAPFWFGGGAAALALILLLVVRPWRGMSRSPR